MQVEMDDGAEVDRGARPLFDLLAGHDAWVIGDKPRVMVDISRHATRDARGGQVAPSTLDPHIAPVRKGCAAFDTGDIETLKSVLPGGVLQYVPGRSHPGQPRLDPVQIYGREGD
jgi:hypothetical protein